MLIAVAGGLGAVSRYGVTVGCTRLFGESFPFGTFVANIAGCLLIGFIMQANLMSELIPAPARLPVTIGFLGALTTFSTFSLEATRYINNDAWGMALTYVGASLLVGISATFLGILVARTVLA